MARLSIAAVVLLLGVALISTVAAVDRSNFKTCDQSSFCKRNRKFAEAGAASLYIVHELKQDASRPAHLSGSILDGAGNVLTLDIYSLKGDIIRVQVNEANEAGRKKRWSPREVLEKDIADSAFTSSLADHQGDANVKAISFGRDKQLLVQLKPFKVEVWKGQERALSANSRGFFNFEVYRQRKPEGEEDGAWEETFKTHQDSKPNGPSSVALDISFIGSEQVYGIPEHASHFALRPTRGSGLVSDPYRLYNLDVFEYELDNPMALYGSVPFMLSHDEKKSAGVFWFNGAETWVDVATASDGSLLFAKPQVDTHWMSESGLVDVFFFVADTPRELFSQYTSLTGRPSLPPLFAIGYHQCKWNYKDEADVLEVNANFDAHGIPYDVIWLDIEHTDAKKYFTWDPRHFPHPEDMQSKLAGTARHLVTIVDPHIKRDQNYRIHTDAQARGLYVKNKGGQDYEGWCWPGSSAYPDFTNPEVREWWSSKFAYNEYTGSTHILHVWNDMNEPSVFNGPEVSMYKDNVHYEGFEHRDVHNLYGYYVHMATYEGLRRRNTTERPFVLSRAAYAGTQRWGAIWTGDNKADWGHLKIAQPMLLSLGVAGITFVGADVGGFFGNPSAELVLRWYQAAAFHPFFRAHAHLDSKRREPWLFGEPFTSHMRNAIRTRYVILPYLYTLFAEATRTGMPIMRPLWAEYPALKAVFAEENLFLLGPALLVAPVAEEGQKTIEVNLPGEHGWYDFWAPDRGLLSGRQTVALTLDTIPVYLRAGAILPEKVRPRRSSACMANDPYTFVVAAGKDGRASGSLWVDDERSFEYQQGHYADYKLEFDGTTFSCTRVAGSYASPNGVERVIIHGLSKTPTKVTVRVDGGAPINTSFAHGGGRIVIRKPAVTLLQSWTATLEF